jgi:hypothetical protein
VSIPSSYQHALDSGVYLCGVDTSDPGIRRPVPQAAAAADAAVFLITGQSNAANHGERRFAAQRDVFNFNLFDGELYVAADPLLGATGDGGSPSCLLGDRLIATGFAPSVFLCPIAVGGASVAEWAPGGPYNHRLGYALERMRKRGLWPSHVLWHQGEADALAGLSGERYRERFLQFAGSLRAMGVDAPLYAARASYFAVPTGHDASQTVINAAQEQLPDASTGIFAGPDTDVLRAEWRHDGCHLAAEGLIRHAELWFEVLTRPRPQVRR